MDDIAAEVDFLRRVFGGTGRSSLAVGGIFRDRRRDQHDRLAIVRP